MNVKIINRDGALTLTMPKPCKKKGFLRGKTCVGQEFVFDFVYNQTELFEIL